MIDSQIKSLPEVISNSAGLYEGNLEHYLRVLFTNAQNLWFPYHNFRHMLHVTWLAYQGCEFYKDHLSKVDMRDILVAALFHDFDHSGMLGNDDLNIERAVRALIKYQLPEDRPRISHIIALIRATEYPPTTKNETLCADILRDADLSQAFSTAWVQQVVFGLAAEWRQSPLEVLRQQHGFLSSLKLRSDWARGLFPQEVIDAKIAEANALLSILEKETEGLS
jgi:hypothetical protein